MSTQLLLGSSTVSSEIRRVDDEAMCQWKIRVEDQGRRAPRRYDETFKASRSVAFVMKLDLGRGVKERCFVVLRKERAAAI